MDDPDIGRIDEEFWQVRSKARLAYVKVRLFPEMPSVRREALATLQEVRRMLRKIEAEHLAFHAEIISRKDD